MIRYRSTKHRRRDRRFHVEHLEYRNLLAQVTGVVWNDWNRDGHFVSDDREHVVADVQVNLLEAATGEAVSSTRTDRDGVFDFPQLDPGDYVLEFVPQDDVEFTPPNIGVEEKDSDVIPASGKTAPFSLQADQVLHNVNAGIYSKVAAQSIAGRVWSDINTDGVQDPGEPGIRNVEVQVENLYDNKLYEIDSNESGEFFFDGAKLLPGEYQLEFKIPKPVAGGAKWQISPPHARDGTIPRIDSDLVRENRTLPFVIEAATSILPPVVSFDAGMFQSAQIVGSIWHDIDRDGSRDAAEYGLERYSVTLLDADGQPRQSTSSDLDGIFRFIVDPGSYYVEVEVPRGVIFTRQYAPNGSIVSEVDRQTGRSSLLSVANTGATHDISVGLLSNSGTQSLIGRVWHDLNANGIQDPGEFGIANSEVELENSGFVELLEVETDASGFFRIDGAALLPGSYHLDFNKPTKTLSWEIGPRNANGNVISSLDNDAQSTNGKTAPIALRIVEGEERPVVRKDAGFFVSTTIEGGIWDDADANGYREDAEDAVAGVTVELLTAQFSVVATDTTNRSGRFEFKNVKPSSDYQIRIESMPNVAFSPRVSGATDRVSSIRPATGVSFPFAVGSQSTTELWAGIHGTDVSTGIEGYVWDDTDGNGIQDSQEAGVPDVTVRAFSGGRVHEAVTNEFGQYVFADVVPGQYKLKFHAPDSTTFSPIYQGTDPSVDSDVNRWTGRTRDFSVISGQIHDSIDAGIYRGPIESDVSAAIRLTEIAFIGHGETEFVEIKNISDKPVSLEGVRFTAGVRFDFSNSPTTSLFPNEYVIVYGRENNAEKWERRERINIAGLYDGDLDRDERLTLVDRQNREITNVSYDDDWFVITDREYLPWSLTAIDEAAPTERFNSSVNWRPSSLHGGSPGTADPRTTPDPESIVINEVLTKSSDGFNDLIEIHNRTDEDFDIGYWYLGDYNGDDEDPTETLTRYRIAPGTILPAGGYLTLSREDNFASDTDLGTNSQFGLSSFGESLHLIAANEYGEMLGYSHSVSFAGTDVDISYGRVELSDGTSTFTVMAQPTFGGPNSEPEFGPVVIDQIMYLAENGDHYIRLKNISQNAIETWVDEEGGQWRIGGTVDYRFESSDAGIPAGGYGFLTGMGPDEFRSKYGVPNEMPVYGPYYGSMGPKGGEISLYRPGLEDRSLLTDRVAYRNVTPWPVLPGDVALTRRSATILGEDPLAWIDSTVINESPETRHLGSGQFFMHAFETSAAAIFGHDVLSVAVGRASAGDANGDGVFNSRDFVHVFQANKYNKSEFASWTEGDWNLDGIFNSTDFVTAFTMGGFADGV